MIRIINKFIFQNLLGWKIEGVIPDDKKIIAIVAPHTSWHDLFVGIFTRSVLKMEDRIKFLGKAELFKIPIFGYVLKKLGVYSVAICSNDFLDYPEDSFEEMKRYSEKNNFSFPYLHDPDQNIARLYGAICTPDFFGFNKEGELQYRGRLDASGKEENNTLDRDLLNAMIQISRTGKGPKKQLASIGCSIKWKK